MIAADPPRHTRPGEPVAPVATEPTVDPAQPHGPLVKFHAPEVVFGVGSLGEAGYAASRLGARRPFVVTDPGIVEAGWVAELLSLLREQRLSPVLWTGVTPNPKDHEIRAAFETYREQEADIVVAIGGGSCIDAAKGVAILSGSGGDILDYAGIDKMAGPIPPLLMIPSTSGTGADVSQFCIVTDTERHVKLTIMGRALVPDVSITDPRLLTTMPAALNAATGLDALTHGIESYVSLAHNPLADGHALNSVGLVVGHLQQTISHPRELEARSKMAQASLQAGLAFTNAILGATHAMSHQVGGLLDAPHGVVNGVLLPHVIRYNARAVPERFIGLARSAGLRVDGMPGEEAAELLAIHVRMLGDEVGVPRGLRELGVTEEDIEILADTTLEDACLTTNPRAASRDDIRKLFQEAL
ncbi:MAG: iron-containing alcohol dehydrogenase [Nocardioides sp.]|uniref:iron-containing alcohol dehydrogenase n=1 Tax=Nocardioides sp. TaxID=35761 RepID=UPI0039E2B9FD